MRKLVIKQIEPSDVSMVLDQDALEHDPADIIQVSDPNGSSRLLFFTFKSNDIDEGTMNRLKEQIKILIDGKFPDTQSVAICLRPTDSFEVYELES